MALSASDVHGIVERVCARQDVLDACSNRDLGAVIEVLGAHGVTQGQIAGLTGLPQGRLSEYKKRKRAARASSTFEAFADGLGMPAAARLALGLAPDRSADADTGTQLPGGLPPDAGRAYPDAPAEAAENVGRLWRADLGDAQLLQARLEPGAWNDASLRWLVDPGHRTDNESAGGVRIGMADIERFRATAELFRQLDDRFGGGHGRQALIQYLSTDADRLLRGRHTDAVGRALFSATAEATLLAAWMTYDSVPGSSLAQRYFIQALALARAGDDRLLGASVLDAMSHQATYTGRFGEAASLARAAMTGTRGIATATLTAHFHTDRRPDLDEESRRAISPGSDSSSNDDGAGDDLPPEAGTREETTAEDALWFALCTAPDEGADIGELMRATGMSRPTLYRRLREHAEAGRAIQVGRGRWRASTTEEPSL